MLLDALLQMASMLDDSDEFAYYVQSEEGSSLCDQIFR
jgi:hypothetical protein